MFTVNSDEINRREMSRRFFNLSQTIDSYIKSHHPSFMLTTNQFINTFVHKILESVIELGIYKLKTNLREWLVNMLPVIQDSPDIQSNMIRITCIENLDKLNNIFSNIKKSLLQRLKELDNEGSYIAKEKLFDETDRMRLVKNNKKLLGSIKDFDSLGIRFSWLMGDKPDYSGKDSEARRSSLYSIFLLELEGLLLEFDFSKSGENVRFILKVIIDAFGKED